MNSATRTIRPFDLDKRLEHLLADSVLHFGEQSCEAGRSIVVADGFEQSVARLRWVPDERFADFVQRLREGVSGSGLRLEDACVAVIARSRYLKINETVFRHSLADPGGLASSLRLDEDSSGSRRSVFCTSSNGLSIEAFVALAETVPIQRRAPLQPWRAGTWLASASFRVRCRNDAELFRPQPLDADDRNRLGLMQGTVTFAEFDGGELTDPEAASDDACTFWVDKDLLERIDAQPRAPAAEFLQRWLFAEFLTAVIREFNSTATTSAAPAYDDLRASMIGRVAALLAGSGAATERRAEVLRQCRDDPAKAIALAQDVLKLRRASLRAFGDQQ